MADNITFHQYNNLHDIEDSWRSLDQQAERLSLGYIHYTYYQTYEWNEFLYHHPLRGLGALTTAMRYDLVRVGGRPFAILPMAVTRSSKKARIPSCRVGGVLNMVCPYPYEGHEEVMEAIAAHLLMPRLAIDTSFGRYSPGILLILEAAKRWMAEGVVDFDMCRGDERYKKEMGGINEPLCRIETRV